GPDRGLTGLGDRAPGLALPAATEPLDGAPAALGAPIGRGPALGRHAPHPRRAVRHGGDGRPCADVVSRSAASGPARRRASRGGRRAAAEVVPGPAPRATGPQWRGGPRSMPPARHTPDSRAAR